jgi:hypothetical protein
MNVALPVLLLMLGGVSFWLLTESKIKWYIKTTFIALFCACTILFWFSMHSYLGWPANSEDMPETVSIHWVIIKEPNKLTQFDGQIYLLLESNEEVKRNAIVKFFSFKSDVEVNAAVEPRLYGLPYSRKLHEKLEKEVMPKLKGGQVAKGKFTKAERGGESKEKGDGQKSHGGESQKQEWQFHELLPSEIHRKPSYDN